MKKIFHSTINILIFSALLVSCNNDEETDSLNAVYNDAASQTAYNDVVSIGDESVIDDDLTSFKMDDAEKISAPCATITKDSSSLLSWITTIDFGSVNCLCNDGKNRRGKIVVTHPPISSARDSGAVFHYEFIDHYINDNKLFGFINVTDSGMSTNGGQLFYIDLIGGLELADGHGSITWESHQRKYYDEGFNTPNTRLDDKVRIFGSGSGITQTGESFTSQIGWSAPLRQRFSVNCRKYFFAGTVIVTPQDKPERTINYGETTPEVCDDFATVTVNGNTYTINLDNSYE